MENYIAIKKLSIDGAKLSGNIASRRKKVRTQSIDPVIASALASEGLEQFDIREQEKRGPSRQASFATLDKVGAVILEAPKSRIDKVREFLEEEYYIVPDIKLSLPQATGVAALGERAQVNAWPETSGVPSAHDSGVKGGNVIVGVLDSGVDADHVQFSDTEIDFRYFPPRDPQSPRAIRGFDPGGHGTHVCGIIAGKNIGVAPEVDLMVASVIESEKHSTSLRRIIAALEWVANRVVEPGNETRPAIVNLSLGFRPHSVSAGSEKVFIAAVRDTLASLAEIDVLPVVALGNEGAGTFRYPGAFPEVVGVGAVDEEHRPWADSGGGTVSLDNMDPFTKPDLVGYGVEIYSSYERNLKGHSRYATRSGTSMAAPYVTGIAALLAQQHDLRGQALRNKLFTTALPLDPPHPKERIGNGLARFR